MDVRDRPSAVAKESQFSADLSAADVARLRRENRRLRRQMDVVSGSWIYTSSLLLAALKRRVVNSSKRIFAPLQGALRPVASGKHQSHALLSKSVLFDKDWYVQEAAQAGWNLSGDALEHYLATGWAAGLSPSPYFDPAFVAAQVQVKETGKIKRNELLNYLNNRDLKPCLLFDNLYFTGEAVAAGVSPAALAAAPDLLSFYLTEPLCENVDCSPLFNSRFYISAYGFETSVSTARSAWKHFMVTGRKQLRQPNPFFVPTYYKRHFNSLDSVNDSLLILGHYIDNIFPIGARPHPDFDIDFYGAQVKSRGLDLSTVSGGNPLLHFLTVGRSHGIYPETRIQSMMAERESLSEFERLELDAYQQSDLWLDMNMSTWCRILNIAKSDKKVMLFIGHEASLTGAPMVLLSLVEEFARRNYDCIVMLARGGALTGKYQASGAVGLLDSAGGAAFRATAYARFIKANVASKRIAGVIANTVEVADVQKAFQGYGLESVCLAHEVADSYPDGYFANVVAASKKMIFSSEFLQAQAAKRCHLESIETLVRPQGLIGADRDFVLKCSDQPDSAEMAGSFERARKYVRDEIKAPDDAFVVLTIGTLDSRKGIDLFAQIVSYASRFKENAGQIHFVWIGDGVKKSHSPYYYAVWDIAQCGQTARVHFLPPRQPLDPWYMGADLYLLSSRQDPLPCVAQSAMGAGLPLVAFANSGGIPEYMAGSAGTVVPYGDASAAAEAVFAYYESETLRREHGNSGRQMVSAKFDFGGYFEFIEANL